jgi:hypothetical protein
MICWGCCDFTYTINYLMLRQPSSQKFIYLCNDRLRMRALLPEGYEPGFLSFLSKCVPDSSWFRCLSTCILLLNFPCSKINLYWLCDVPVYGIFSLIHTPSESVGHCLLFFLIAISSLPSSLELICMINRCVANSVNSIYSWLSGASSWLDREVEGTWLAFSRVYLL